MSDTASIARPYAKAVYQIASEADDFSVWGNALKRLADVATDNEFVSLLNDPRVNSDQIAALLIELSGEALPESGQNFINLLVRNDRVAALADISSQFQDLVASAQKSIKAEVVTAMALSSEQQEAIKTALEQRLGLSVALQESVDADLLGGAIIKAGDLVIDGSARGRIEKMTSALMR